MVGQDLVSPRDDRVHHFSVFGDLAGSVEIGEPSQRLVGAIEVVRFVELVELLERVSGGSETGMSIEQPIQMLLVGVAEMIRPPQEREAGSEQMRLERRGTLIWGAALQLPPHQGETFGEPPGDVKTVQHVESIGALHLHDQGIPTDGARILLTDTLDHDSPPNSAWM